MKFVPRWKKTVKEQEEIPKDGIDVKCDRCGNFVGKVSRDENNEIYKAVKSAICNECGGNE